MIIRLIVFSWLVFLLMISKGTSQSYFEVFSEKVTNENFKDKRDFVDSLLIASYKNNAFLDHAKIANEYGLKFYYYTYNIQAAILYGNKSINTIRAHKELQDSYFSNALYNLGKYYLNVGNYLNAESFFREVIALDNNKLEIGKAYCGIGDCFKALGDLYKATDYYVQGLPYLRINKTYHTNNALTLALIYETINSKKSLENKLKLLEDIEAIEHPDSMLLSWTHNYYAFNDAYASYYDNPETLDPKKAIQYHAKNLKAAKENNDDYLFYNIYTNLGALYTTIKNDSAVYYLDKGFQATQDFQELARNKNLLAMYHLQTKNPSLAIDAGHSAISQSLSSKNIESLPSAKVLLEESVDRDVTLWSQINKATALIQLFYRSNNIEHIEEALKLLRTADEFINLINTKELEENSKFYWREEAADIYSKIVLCVDLLNKPEQAITALEKSKALLLTETILNNQAKKNIPEKITLKENQLKQEIDGLTFQLKENSNDSLQASLFNSKQEYEQYLDSVRVEFPWYKSVNEVSEIFNIDDIQKTLTENQVILWYSLSTNTDYINKASVVLLTNNSIEIEILENQTMLLELIEQYRTFVSRPLETKEELKSFRKISFELYEVLVPETYRSILKNKKVTIIPEGDLQNVPFESLITELDSDIYLLYNTQISYAYSMSSLLHAKDIDRKASKSLIGYAPINFAAIGLPDLTYSEEELQNINHHMDSDLYTSQNATSSSFLNESKEYNIIHLATHADATRNPWISFSDRKLMLHELYTLDNNADLVVLSACNTSQGEYAIGEGVLSLARGFFHSGANSVIASLWTVNDKQTTKLTSNFYKNLAEGQPKVSALHNAKINYLRTHDLTDASPYYWASLVLIGDTDRVNFAPYVSLYYVIIAILIVIAILFILKRRKKKYL